MPKRVVLVHIECAGYAHGAARSVLGRQALAVEQQLVFTFEEVRGLALLLFVARAALAAIAGDKATTAAKVVDGELAVIGATAAARMLLRDGESSHFLGGEDSGDTVLTRAVARE